MQPPRPRLELQGPVLKNPAPDRARRYIELVVSGLSSRQRRLNKQPETKPLLAQGIARFGLDHTARSSVSSH